MWFLKKKKKRKAKPVEQGLPILDRDLNKFLPEGVEVKLWQDSYFLAYHLYVGGEFVASDKGFRPNVNEENREKLTKILWGAHEKCRKEAKELADARRKEYNDNISKVLEDH